MDIIEKNPGALNSLKEDLENKEEAKKKTHILKKMPKNPAKEYSSLEGNVFKRNSEGQLEKLSRNSEGFLEKKAKGASDEMSRQITRDSSIEDNLSEGLEDKEDFVKKFKMVDEKRVWIYERAKNIINNIKEDVIFNTKYVLDEEGIKAMKELEKELTDPFAKIVYEKMSDLNKQLLLDHLVDNQISPDKSETIILEYISEANFNTVCFSDNGYLMQLADKKNKEDNENTLYNIVSPDGKIIAQDLDNHSAYDKLEELSAAYQKELKEEFLKNTPSTDLKMNDQIAQIDQKEPLVVMTDKEYMNAYYQAHGLRIGLINGRVFPEFKENINKISGEPVLLDEKESFILNSVDDKTFLDLVDYIKTSKLKQEDLEFIEVFKYLSPEQKEIISNIYKEKELAIELVKDVLDEPIIPPVENQPINFDSEIVDYAKEMGVKLEDLNKNQEFTSLNTASQKFILEVLNRSSLSKIKVEAANNFKNEKDQKKWYQLGFAFNQNFHKKKHEILVAKDIHEKGLEGYGEAEFSWLTNVVANGPEMNVDEDGSVSVNYLRSEEGDNSERQKLIADYNRDAYDVSGISPDDKDYDWWVNDLNNSRKALLNSAKDPEDGIELASKLVEAEKQLKLYQFLKGEYKTEKIIRDMVNNSLSGWDETKMLIGGQKDKVGYAGIGMAARTLLRSEHVMGLIGKGTTYAIGPIVAFCVGGYRANIRAAKTIDENAALAKLGVKDASAMAENLNLAVGKAESDGKVINLGLSDKLDSLVDRFNLLKNKIDRINRIEKEGGEIPDDLLLEDKNETIEHLSQRLLEDKNETRERLSSRIDFTSQKVEDGLVSLGDPKDRAINYYKLLNSLENAKTIIFTDLDILNYKVKNTKVDKNITKLTRSKGDVDVEKLRELSIEDRLASFLNYNEEKRQSAEFKYLVTETTKGAVLGASFAVAGAWVFEHTGLGDWTSAQLSHAGKFLHTDQALNSLYSAWEGTKNLFSGSPDGSADNTEVITKTVSGASVKNLISTKPEITNETTESVKPTTEKIVNAKTETPETKVVNSKPDNVTTEKPIPQTAKPEAILKPKVYSEEVKSGGSVWQSTRNIFRGDPEGFGYKGDMNDSEAINHWSEVKTANVFHNSGEIKNLVYEGNTIKLIPDGDNFKIEVEQGSGFEPKHLDYDSSPKIPDSLKGVSDYSANSYANEAMDKSISDFKTVESIVDKLVSNQEVVSHHGTEVANNFSKALIKATGGSFHLKSGQFELTDKGLIFNSSVDKSKIIFDSTGKVIKGIFDADGKDIPNEFINRNPTERFLRRGGLEKGLSSWSKLNDGDKSIYKILGLKPEDLLKKITELFNIKTDQGVIVEDKIFSTDSGRHFDKSLDGVKKLVKFLSRK